MVSDPNRMLYKNADPTGEAARAQRIADQYGFPYVDLEHFQIDHGLFQTIPLDLMIRYQFLPERRENGHIAVVVGDPTDVLKLDELELLLGAPLRIKVASPGAIRDKLQKSESTQRVLDEATEGFRMQLVGEDEDGEETLTIDSITQQESSPIIRLVDSIVFNAIQRRASDVHIETRDNEVVVKYRIDGVLYEALDPIDKRHHSTIISRIKVMSELDIAEKRVPQDGRFKLRITGRTIDFRVSIIPSAHGEDCVIRILDKESMNKEFKNLRLDVLGFDDEMLLKFRKFIKEPYGMVLVTGPTGSGKTTTLYAALSEIQSSEDKIITIEDPVEYQLRGITQIPVNEKKGLTFARGLRAILRHDPEHEGRPLQLRFRTELRAGTASRAPHLRPLQTRSHISRHVYRGVRTQCGGLPRQELLRRSGMPGVQRHGLPRPRGDLGTARSLGSHPYHDHRPPPCL